MHANLATSDNTDSIEAQFRVVLADLSELFKDIRKYPRSNRSETWSKFRSYPKETQRDCLNRAQLYLEICQTTLNNGGSLSDTSKLLWYAIRKLGLIPSDDLFEYIENSNVVEIYDSNGVQIFRNHRFFDICSYDFPELFTYSWPELYERDDSIDSMIMGYATQIYNKECETTISVEDIPYHKMREKFSPEGFMMEMQERHFSPLKPKSGNNMYLVATSDVRVVKRKCFENNLETAPQFEVHS